MLMKKYRLLQLLLIFVVSNILGIGIDIITYGMISNGVAFYIMLTIGIMIYSVYNEVKWKDWLRIPDVGGIPRIIVSWVLILLMIVLAVAKNVIGLKMGHIESFDFKFHNFIGSVCLAPIIEELINRGIIVDILKEKHGNAFTIVVSAIIFYVMHFDPKNINALIFGIILGWLVIKAKSIVPGIIMHAVWNLVIFCMPLIASILAIVLLRLEIFQ